VGTFGESGFGIILARSRFGEAGKHRGLTLRTFHNGGHHGRQRIAEAGDRWRKTPVSEGVHRSNGDPTDVCDKPPEKATRSSRDNRRDELISKAGRTQGGHVGTAA